MKQSENTDIFTTIASFENLVRAYLKTRLGKASKPKVCRFDFFLESEISRLEFELNTNSYRPSRYTHFLVYDPKTRQVAAPDFRDRVVQHSLVSLIEPLFEKHFIFDSYACRKNKGTHFGAKRVKKFLMAARYNYGKNQSIYVLQCDIKKFFQNVSWDILLKIIKKTITSSRTFSLIRSIITLSNVHSAKKLLSWQSEQLSLFSKIDNLSATSAMINDRKGLPIGNLTSQLFANIYLDQLDHFIKERLREKWYGRYMDDFLIIHKDKNHLISLRDKIKIFLKNKLNLQLHPRKSVIKNVVEGIPFVGYRIFYDHTLIRGNSLRRIQKNCHHKIKAFKKNKLTQKELKQYISSINGHFQYANTYNLQQKMFAGMVE